MSVSKVFDNTGSLGTNGQVLTTNGTVATWTTVAGGGGIPAGVNTSTANFFAFYLTGTAVTGTAAMQFSSGAIAFATNTTFSSGSTLSFLGLTTTILVPTSSYFTITRSGTSATATLFSVRDMNNSFGSFAASGAFIQRNSYFGDEFNTYRGTNCSVSTTQSRGDWGSAGTACTAGNGEFSLASSSLAIFPSPTGTRGTFSASSLSGNINGMERLQVTNSASQSSTAAMEYVGTNLAGTANAIWSTSTLPILTAKVRPSIASSTTSTAKYWIGFIASSTSMFAPTSSPDGVYFTNCINASNNAAFGSTGCNQTSWIGMIKNGTSIATTSCAVADSSPIATTTAFNYLRIEFATSGGVRFLVDSNTADGVVENDCGTISLNTALPNMTVFAAVYAENPSITLNLDIDYIRVWQDDNEAVPLPFEGPIVQSTTTLDLSGLSSLGEIYPVADGGGLPEGTVVTLDSSGQNGQVTSSQSIYDPNIIGVSVVGSGLSINNKTIENGIEVATHGRATVRVSSINGKISVGDYLTSSNIPGVAMKATKAGPVIGQAVTSYSGEDVGTVVAAINKMDYLGHSPQTTSSMAMDSESLLSNLVSSLSNITSSAYATTTNSVLSIINTDRVIAGLDIVTPHVVTQHLTVNTLDSSNTSSLSISNLEVGSLRVTSTATFINGFSVAGSSTFSGDVTIDNLHVLKLSVADLENPLINSITSSLAILVGEIDSVTTTIADLATRLSADELLLGTFTSTSSSADVLNLTNLDLKNNLTVHGDTTIAGGLKVEAIDSLTGLTKFLNDITFFGRPYFNADSGGFVVMSSGTQSADIVFDHQYLSQPAISVVISLEAPTTSTATDFTHSAFATSTEELENRIFADDIRYLATNKSVNGFTIKLNKPAPGDIVFSWIALAIKDAKIILSTPLPDTIPDTNEITPSADQPAPMIVAPFTSDTTETITTVQAITPVSTTDSAPTTSEQIPDSASTSTLL